MINLAKLNDEADDYLRTLPGLIYPQALADKFARIANEIVDYRYNEPKLRDYFESLLNDNRSSRQGFAPSVLQDIQHLREMMLDEFH